MSKLVGTCGYDYKLWIDQSPGHKVYYSSSRDKFKKYCSDFNFLEMNHTFYKVPTLKSIEKMYKDTPSNFKYLTKFSQYITHSTRFTKFNQGWDKFMTPVCHLKEKLAGVLFQFSKTFHFTPENEILFREANTYINKNEEKYGKVLIYIELRDAGWFCQEGVKLLTELGWITVISSNFFGNMPPDFIITRPNYTMFRFHGLDGHCYGDYSDEILKYYVNLTKDIDNVIFTFNNVDTLVGQIYSKQPTNPELCITFGDDGEAKMFTSDQQLPYLLLRREVTQNTPHAIKNAKTVQQLLLKNNLKFIYQYSASDLQKYVSNYTTEKYENIYDLRYMAIFILYEYNLLNNEDTALVYNNREIFRSILEQSDTIEQLRLNLK